MVRSIFNKLTYRWFVLTSVVFILLQFFILTGIIKPYQQITVQSILINIILAVSLNLVIGITGQFSLGHAGFMSIGAYSAAIFIKMIPNLLGLGLGMVVGLILVVTIALIVAFPVLKLKGDYLAIATLGASEIIRIVIQNLDITNRAAGISNIEKLSSISLLFAFAVLAVILVVNFKRSAVGRACISISQDEIASETMGINTTKYKTIAFLLGAMLASIAGSLYASSFYVVLPTAFSIDRTVDILIIVVLGGMGSLSGSIVAAIVLGVVNIGLQSLAQYRTIIYASALIIMMIFRPQGLLGNFEFSFIRKAKQKKNQLEAKS